MDMELLEVLSSNCLTKLNRERDLDLKSKLLKAYKTLFIIGVNLSSRSNFASLLYEAETRLSQLLQVKHVSITIIDHENDRFVKLNHGHLTFIGD